MRNDKIKTVFTAQLKRRDDLRKTGPKERTTRLRKLKSALQKYEEDLFEALYGDLRKNRFEAALTELYFSYSELDFAIKHLPGWMKPKSVGRTTSNFFARSRIYMEPKGRCLIMAPWNYPLQLIMSPLISAIAAGNCVMLKPSELSPKTSAVIHKLIQETFDEDEICCVEGDAQTAEELLKLPFDHIFFTGSSTIGKVVMEAASRNLSSVTLELGGKSPVIIDASANLRNAAEKIAWGKLVNAGQTCIAPDYILIDKKREQDFIALYKTAVEKFFFIKGVLDKSAYGRIINRKHFDRLGTLLNQAVLEGAKVESGGGYNEADLTLEPTLLSNISPSSSIMEEEIFGPILPLIGFERLDEALYVINEKAKPLALYIFSEDKGCIQQIIRETSAGGTCINDVLVHISNPNLPFGGVNHSGIGSCHGQFGYKAFSHERAVMFQPKLNFTRMIYPPYSEKMGLLKWLKKFM